MKQLNTKDWTTIEDMGGLILFVQLMEELLFHFNTHSNKVHATNVRTLVFEANNILMKIDVEKVKSSNILPVIEEIKKNIQSDSVAKELLGIKEDYLIKGLNSTENFSEISASIDAMMRHLGNGRYLNEAKKQLLEVIGDPKKKKLIAKLTRLLVSELLNLGYDKQYLYFYLKELFITPKNKVNPTENINKYFELFDGNRKKFKVCRLVNKDYLLFNEIASLLDFKLKRKEELSEDISEKEKKFFSYIRNNEVIFESQYLALDPYHATHLCNSHLKTISNVNSFYSHHKQLKWNQFSLVYNNSGYVNVIEPPVNLMSTRPNKKAEEVIKYAILTLSGRGLAKESLVRLRKVMALHGDAMKTDSRQSQLLNLWSALETLFPVSLSIILCNLSFPSLVTVSRGLTWNLRQA
ncbi:hypothetical protein [Paenibacillus validus]|uniref:Uncharacterized protein n=1 Tax=Paenibacillus validus TaxID=44253 RepID=A0A7X2ZFV4_9BACL|nr:hypothetical protein [Paenibacillus validus]MUG74106.1 hypothetical protein [Paenibacillus validus]